MLKMRRGVLTGEQVLDLLIYSLDGARCHGACLWLEFSGPRSDGSRTRHEARKVQW